MSYGVGEVSYGVELVRGTSFLDKRFELFFIYGAVSFFDGFEILFVFVVAVDGVVQGWAGSCCEADVSSSDYGYL